LLSIEIRAYIRCHLLFLRFGLAFQTFSSWTFWRWFHFLLSKPLQFLLQLDLHHHYGFVHKCHNLCKELVWIMMQLVGLLK